ncbi:hypothetical protein QTG54_008103 [Skeletonema marinoi]|uniref:F-box domain-containing protein n=1 Tax=Skeletonema marinoi TaxID=267567 RepID=A0AAD8Y8S3_9STRA|nr:hypothetical protein QTG54_008103 [Skeletonema marinoi]
MASAANDSSKRRRILGDDASPDAGCLSELPSGILTHVANYLDAPSRALFAAALINQNAVASDERNTAIVGNEWTTLDFGEIEKELAVKLNDDDIEKVLQCIDAANRVKKLKLTNCIHITGAGLEPLRGSSIIEQIDLSLVGKHQSPRLSSRPPISREFVLPILDSIIEAEGCSLRHLQFPSAWRGSWRSDRGFEQILRHYNELLVNRGGSCVKCNVSFPEDGSWGCSSYGSQKYTCYECLKYYCEVCTDDDDEYMLSYCSLCERRLCVDCQKKKWCNGCEGDICMDCTDFTDCSGCGAGLCKDCIGNEGIESKCCKCEGHFCEDCNNQIYDRCNNCKMYICRDCDEEYNWLCCNFCQKCFCNECNEKKGTKAIQICDGCDTSSCCGDCRVLVLCQVYGETKDCTGCIHLAGPLLLEEVKKVKKEHAEVKAENGTLKDANGYKQDQIKYLKEQLQYQKEQIKELEEK